MTTLDQWAEYLTACGQSPASVGIRVRTIEALTNHSGVGDPLNLRRSHVVSFLARPLKPWSKLTYWKSIDRWCSFLRDFEHDPEADLLKGIPRPRTPESIARPITDETISRLLAATLTPRAGAYVRLALYAALRVHEIAKVRGEDFDWNAGWMSVTGKGGSTAILPIHPGLRVLGERMPEFGYWFRSPLDPREHVSARAVSETIGAALQSVGSNATAHQLRDTAATRMQRQVRDIRVTQTMLRHKSLRSTMKYTGVSDDSMQAAVLSLEWPSAA